MRMGRRRCSTVSSKCGADTLVRVELSGDVFAIFAIKSFLTAKDAKNCRKERKHALVTQVSSQQALAEPGAPILG